MRRHVMRRHVHQLIGIAVVAAVLGGCDQSAADAQDVVDAAYATYNEGDVDAWARIRDRGSSYESDEQRDQTMAQLRDRDRDRVRDGAHYADIACEGHGDGAWPVADDGDVDGYYLTCDAVLVLGDGTELPESFEWVVDDGEVVAVRSDR